MRSFDSIHFGLNFDAAVWVDLNFHSQPISAMKSSHLPSFYLHTFRWVEKTLMQTWLSFPLEQSETTSVSGMLSGFRPPHFPVLHKRDSYDQLPDLPTPFN